MLHKATYSMLLFGIPHKGMVVDHIQRMLSTGERQPRSTLVRQIESNSDLLQQQLSDFKNLIGDRKIVSFYEMGQTRRPELVSSVSIQEILPPLNKSSRILKPRNGGEWATLR
jgi:hypothetical protein